MTRREAERLTHQQNALMSLGFTYEEADKLRRISMTLQRWFEHECNGNIRRDEITEKAYWCSAEHPERRYSVADRERGALKRLHAILHRRNLEGTASTNGLPVSSYIQGDPRGAALYIIRPGDVPAGQDVGAYYSRGICVY